MEKCDDLNSGETLLAQKPNKKNIQKYENKNQCLKI